MDTVQKIPQDPAAAFSISDLAERTGLSAATLRTWETRHGFPEPVRRPGGHRRYTEHHVSQVRQVLEHRARGLTLEAAIAATTRESAATDHSVFAGVRRRHPALVTRTLRKSTLLALTHAMEDECCARSREPLLVAGFQDERFLRQAEARWRELSRTAHAAVVFAALTAPHEPAAGTLLRVHLPDRAALRREWFLVCDAPDFPAFLSAWEVPGQQAVRDADRRFEAVWSLDPTVVREASRIALTLARELAPERADELPAPPEWAPREVSADLREATSMFDRMLTYVDRARP